VSAYVSINECPPPGHFGARLSGRVLKATAHLPFTPVSFLTMFSRINHSLATSGAYQQHARATKLLTTHTAGRRAFSQSATRQSYEDTIRNLLIHKDTRVLCQGFTGKTVREHAPFTLTLASDQRWCSEHRALSM
jgi:hypothetical protein